MRKSLLLMMMLLVTVLYGSAQVTTSSLSGLVTQSGGQVVAGATVKAVHTPSGTSYSTSANAAGRYNIANMRVGGPYRVEVTSVGQSPVVREDIYLELGQPFVLNVEFGESGLTIDEVSVSAGRNPLLNSDRTGAVTTVSRAQIDKLPSISRSVNDLTRLTPQANGTSIGGGNYRSNNFTVDGANFNNQFGIGQNVPAGGSPISVDALEQISVNITPYDVRQSGFTGASINAVTRSGKNNFFGSAFYTGRTQNQQGTRVNNVATPVSDMSDKNYGFSFGGPIIKNKLFFFVNAEQNDVVTPGPSKTAALVEGQFGGTVARPTRAFLDQVSKYLKDTYNYETGPYEGYSNDEYNKKFFVRLDWNINENHKLNARYSQVESAYPANISTSTSGSNVQGLGTNRTHINALHFQNSNYFQENNLYSATLEYNGRTGVVNHSARVAYIHQNEPRSSGGGLFPLVDILDGTSARNVLTTFGYEPFTYGNLRDVTTYTLNYDANVVFGSHSLTAGLQYETSDTKNGFQRFGTGYYVYNSWEDFVNNADPYHYALTYPLTADGSQAFPKFTFNQYSFFIQDEFTVNSRLKLTGGLRLELPTFPSVPEIKTHPLIAALTFPNGDKVNTGVLPKTRLMVAPRFGFNYDVMGDRSIQVRGGSGIFVGRVPFVWIVSQSGDAGLIQATVTNLKPKFSPDIKANYPATLPDPTTRVLGDVSVMSPDLKFPSTWKSSLAADFKLPLGFVATVEGIYNSDINAAVARKVNYVTPTALNVAGYPDHRLIYPASNNDKYIYKLSGGQLNTTSGSAWNATMLDNAKGGHYWSAMFQLTKQLRNGLSGSIAYVRSGGKNFQDGAGDQLASYWGTGLNSSGNPNVPELGYSGTIVPNAVVGSISYEGQWIGKLKTAMTIYYNGSEQGRYSYAYNGDFNRDGQSGNDLMYIPANPSEITFVQQGNFSPAEQSARFFELIENDPYLKTRKGQYAERNGAVLPWRNQFDFRFTQELYSGIAGGNNSLQFVWDVMNMGNLLNRSWGVRHSAFGQLLQVASVSDNSAPTFRLALDGSNLPSKTYRVNETISSTYYMQFGVRFNFN